MVRTRWIFTNEMLSHHASNTPTSWDFWWKVLRTAIEKPFKNCAKRCKFQFQVMKSAWNQEIQGRFRRKTTTARKEGIAVSEPVCKAFFAVNWYHAIFSHSFVLLAFFALWVTYCQASDLWMDSFHGKWPITSLYFRSHELYLVHGCSFNPLCKHYVEAVVRCYKLRCNFLASLEGNLFKCLFVKRVWNFFLSWAYYLA